MLPTTQWNSCPMRYFAGLFGDKWTLVILRDILLFKKLHFRQILKSEEGISTNILADRIAYLKEAGVLLKEQDPNNTARLRYVLTKKGEDLLPVFLEMIVWSQQYDEATIVPDSFIQQIKSNRNQVIERILSGDTIGFDSKK